MIYEHSIPKKTYTNHTEKMALLEGEIKEEESKELLAGFLRENLGFTYKLI
ncbi:MAG: hypothetical protein ISP56_06530, partial [Flavobacteriaceae bacterium]|nr:hypothetical protein [Flavobacteriaceae bacterium]